MSRVRLGENYVLNDALTYHLNHYVSYERPSHLAEPPSSFGVRIYLENNLNGLFLGTGGRKPNLIR